MLLYFLSLKYGSYILDTGGFFRMDKGLLLVGKIYYFQKRVPEKLAQFLGIKMYKRSLETDSYSTAKKAVSRLHEVFDEVFKEYKRPYNCFQEYSKEDLLKLLQVEFFKVVDSDRKRVVAVLEDQYLSKSRSGKKIKTLIKMYLNYLDQVKHLSVKTINFNTALLNALSDVVGEKTIQELLVEDFRLYANELKSSKAESSVKGYLSKLKTFLGWVEDTEDVTIPKNIMKFISDFIAGLKDQPERDAFTSEQLRTIFSRGFIKTFKKANAYFPLLLSYTCGLRAGEAVSIKIGDVISYKDRYLIRITEGKTENAKRYVVVPKILHRLGFGYYYEQIKSNNPESSLWGTVLTSNALSRKFTQYLIKIGVKANAEDGKYTEHSLRHSFATKMIASGVDDRFAKKYFGHTGSSLMESRYLIQTPEIEDILQQVDSKLDFINELQDLTPFNDAQMKVYKLDHLKQLVKTVDYKGINVDDYVLNYYRSLNEEQLLNVDTSELDEMNLIAFISVIVEKKILNK